MNKPLLTSVLTFTLLGGCATKTIQEVAVESQTEIKPIYKQERLKHIIEFEYDSSELAKDAAHIIEPHVRYLLENPTILVALQGSASTEGTEQYNHQLATKRAESVKAVMTQLGVESDRIAVLSISETKASASPSRSVTISY